MTTIRVIGYPMPEEDWLHRFRNLGEEIFLTLRDHCAVDLREIDKSVDAFCIRDVSPSDEADIAESLGRVIRAHNMSNSVFFALGLSCAARTVALVFDLDFGERLWSVVLQRDTWVANSAVNRVVIEQMWRRSNGQPGLPSVTMWSVVPATHTESGWNSIIEAVELHHGIYTADPPVDTLCVYGAALTPAAVSALRNVGYEMQRATLSGFLAVKLHAA